jgi:hypothetical protein
MGGRGRAWVASHFSAQAATTPILQLYAEVAIKG